MDKKILVSGRDVCISINGRRLLQAESAILHRISDIHRVRTCFYSGDVAHIEGRREYKLNLVGVRFRQPFENCNYYDLDYFSAEVEIDGMKIILEGCLWDDFKAVADRESFREHISITALKMRTEEVNEGA